MHIHEYFYNLLQQIKKKQTPQGRVLTCEGDLPADSLRLLLWIFLPYQSRGMIDDHHQDR